MANAKRPLWLTHEWFELHPRLAEAVSKHALGLSIVAFVLIVVLLLTLFVWAQILPEQRAESDELCSRRSVAQAEIRYPGSRGLPGLPGLRDHFQAQKK